MSIDMESQVRAYADFLDSTLPVLEASDAMRAPLTQSGEDDACESCGADLAVFDLRHPDESQTPPPRKRRALVLAVAAAILIVAGVVVVADRDDTNVETAPVTSATTPEPVPSPTPPDPTLPPQEVGPPPSVLDSLGYRWSRVPHDEAVFGGEGEQFMNSVTAGGPGLVAVGSAGFDERVYESDAAVWTSVDGLTWSRVPHDEAIFGGDGERGIGSVTAGGPGLVAFGVNDGVRWRWTSVDGLTWERVSSDAFPGGPGIAGGPGRVAVGENEQGAVVWTSVDGLDWSRVAHDEAVFGLKLGDGNAMVDVIAGGPGLVAVGSDGLNSDAPTGRTHAVVWTSVDGLTWSRVPHDESMLGGEGDQGMFDLVVGGPGLVAVGENDQGAPVWTSVDGIIWSRVPHDEAAFNADTKIVHVIDTDAGLVAIGHSGVGYPDPGLWTSTDGITWARVDDAVFGRALISDVTVGGPGLVAVGTDWSGNAAVWIATQEN